MTSSAKCAPWTAILALDADVPIINLYQLVMPLADVLAYGVAAVEGDLQAVGARLRAELHG